jgi:hypothetical protein
MRQSLKTAVLGLFGKEATQILEKTDENSYSIYRIRVLVG